MSSGRKQYPKASKPQNFIESGLKTHWTPNYYPNEQVRGIVVRRNFCPTSQNFVQLFLDENSKNHQSFLELSINSLN